MRRMGHIVILSALLLATFGPGCDPGVTVLNVAPTVTAIGPVMVEDDGRVAIFFWVRDHEEQAADITFELSQDGGAFAPIDVSGGHGDAGLTSDREPAGRPHVVYWDPTGVPAGAQLQLRLTPTDTTGSTGQPTDSASFTLEGGLPAP